jgi:hypothetical protein
MMTYEQNPEGYIQHYIENAINCAEVYERWENDTTPPITAAERSELLLESIASAGIAIAIMLRRMDKGGGKSH